MISPLPIMISENKKNNSSVESLTPTPPGLTNLQKKRPFSQLMHSNTAISFFTVRWMTRITLYI